MTGDGRIDRQPSDGMCSVTLRGGDLVHLLEVQGLGMLMIRLVARFDDPRGKFMPESLCEFTTQEVGHYQKR